MNQLNENFDALTHDTDFQQKITGMTTYEKAEAIYVKVRCLGWPLERTCIIFGISSNWYRHLEIKHAEQLKKYAKKRLSDPGHEEV